MRSSRSLPRLAGALVALLAIVAAGAYLPSRANAEAGAYTANVLRDGPVSFWPLDEPAGPTVFDLLLRNPGSAQNATFDQPGAMAGSSALGFHGTGVVLASGNGLETPSVTIEAWVKTRTGGTPASGPSYGFFTSRSFTDFTVLTARRYIDAGTPKSVTDGRWHYLVGSYGRKGAALYIDGRRVATRGTAGAPNYACCSHGAQIGTNFGNAPHFLTGTVDNVAIYGYALTAKQIAAHYTAAGPAARGMQLTPLFLHERVGKSFSETVGILSYPKTARFAKAGDFHARVSWGDGSSSNGLVVPAPALTKVLGDRLGFYVRAAHRYRREQDREIRITVFKSRQSASAKGKIVVQALNPTAFFVLNPPTPHQAENNFGVLDVASIASVIPAAPGPSQRPVTEYRWDFGDGNAVIDSAKTRPLYTRLLNDLANDPGNGQLKEIAQSLGILPPTGGIFGNGGLSEDEVRKTVALWQAQLPDHIVPHIFPSFGHVGVRLTVTDSAGAKSVYVRNATVSRECLQWGGGGIFGWNPFEGYTTCDTYNGFAAQFGPHRLPPDYVFFSIGSGAKLPTKLPLLRALTVGGGLQLVVTRGAKVFLQLSLSGGLGGAGKQEVVGGGWVGPPAPENRPADNSTIDEFVNGWTTSAGGSLGFKGWGGGWNAVLNTSPTLTGGEELYFGHGASAGASIGGSCAAPLPVPAAVLGPLTALYSQSTSLPLQIDPSVNGKSLDQIVASALVGNAALGPTIEQMLKNCRP
jgi:hypothetical protein